MKKKRCQCDEFRCDMEGCYEFVYTEGTGFIGKWCDKCEHKSTCSHLEWKRNKEEEDNLNTALIQSAMKKFNISEEFAKFIMKGKK